MATLLVVGGSGLLGSKIVAAARTNYDVVATHRSGPAPIDGVEWVELHKENIEADQSIVRRVRPDFVVDTAALHDVDRCEEDRERAWQINAAATAALASTAHALGARYLFISTDFVFDGARGQYRESDLPAPVNYYGVTKAAGEKGTLDADGGNQVVRPSVIYGWDSTRMNFATWLLTSLRDGKEVRIVTDWFGSPTWADDLAGGVLRLLKIPIGGVFHLAGPDRLSRYEFALRLAKSFRVESNLIKPVTAAEFSRKAARPRDSSLVNVRAAEHGILFMGVDESLKRMHSQQDLESFVPPTRFKS